MTPPASDGARPVSYTTPSRTGSGEQLGCRPGSAETEPFAMLSQAIQEHHQIPPTDSLCSAMCHLLPIYPPPSSHHSDGYIIRTTSRPSLRIKSEHAWPSPPLAPGDHDHFDQSHLHQDSSTSAASYVPRYTCSPATSGTWSPVPHAPPHPMKCRRSQPLPDQPDSSGFCTQSLAVGGDDSSTGPYMDSQHGHNGPPGMPLGMSMSSFEPGSLPPEDLLVNTPSSMVTPKDESPSNFLDMPHQYPGTSPPEHVGLQGPDAKLDEPYAKLIYRAFMSRPDRAMTLQDIYQWFRDNTTKAVSEKGGWQNSIRHNLSMNAAFTKRHRKEDGDGFNPLMDDSKRANEWVLEEWAVQYGVQSTTRYRKGNSRRRNSARCANQPSRHPPTQHSAKRAMSGRKGGCAARDSRLRHRAYGQATPAVPVPDFGVDRGLPSPPRSSMPELYHPGSFPLQQFEPMAPAPYAQHGASSGFGPYDGAAPEPFGLMLGASATTSMGHGMHSIDQHRTISAASCGAQMSAYGMPAQGVYPYGVRDVHVGFHGDQQHGARLFEPMPGGMCDWADGSV